MLSSLGPNARIVTKTFKLQALKLARLVGLYWLARRLTGKAVRILCYHGIWLADDRFPGDAMFMRCETFQQRLQMLKERGYPFVSLDEAVDGLNGLRSLPPCATVITIDDGWYSTFSHMTPLLQKQNIPATLYCDSAHMQGGLPIAHVMAHYLYITTPVMGRSAVSSNVMQAATDRQVSMATRFSACRKLATALGVDIDRVLQARAFDYMSPAELKSAADRGLNIELHTHSHSIHDGSAEAVRQEIDANRTALSAWIGKSPQDFQHFCYPSGIGSLGSIQALHDAGVKSATTTEQGLAWPGDDPLLLCRILDNGALTPIEFEAEISGFMDLVRRAGWPVWKRAAWRRDRRVGEPSGERPPIG